MGIVTTQDAPPNNLLDQNNNPLTDGLPPIVTPASFSIVDAINAPIGTVTATNSPTAFAIASGNAAGYFAIDSSGNLSTTGVAAPVGSYTLGVTASNADGTSAPAAVGVTLLSPTTDQPSGKGFLRIVRLEDDPLPIRPRYMVQPSWIVQPKGGARGDGAVRTLADAI